MYDRLTNNITAMGNENVILGGDWNATWDNSRADKNLDVLNMTAIPSYIRSNAVLKMSGKLKLTDPYRIFYPDRRDFTFIPSAVGQNNRSRLDFFLVSESVSDKLVNCTFLTQQTVKFLITNRFFSASKGIKKTKHHAKGPHF